MQALLCTACLIPGGEEEQFILDELMTNITTQASNISKAVAELQKLMDGIKE